MPRRRRAAADRSRCCSRRPCRADRNTRLNGNSRHEAGFAARPSSTSTRHRPSSARNQHRSRGLNAVIASPRRRRNAASWGRARRAARAGRRRRRCRCRGPCSTRRSRGTRTKPPIGPREVDVHAGSISVPARDLRHPCVVTPVLSAPLEQIRIEAARCELAVARAIRLGFAAPEPFVAEIESKHARGESDDIQRLDVLPVTNAGSTIRYQDKKNSCSASSRSRSPASQRSRSGSHSCRLRGRILHTRNLAPGA